MALIQCKYCGQSVSDKAKACPHCGKLLIEDIPEENTSTVLICEDCGAEIPDGAEACPICGCPVPSISEPASVPEQTVQKVEISKVSLSQSENSKKMLKKVGIIVASLVAVIAIGLGIHSSNKKAEEERIRTEYYNNLVSVTSKMFDGAVLAEDASSLIHDVWYNCIYEKSDTRTDKYTKSSSWQYHDDFNTALRNLFSDSTFISETSSIEANQNAVASLMKNLKNPPDEYRDAYDDLKNLYDAYLAITECAVNPTGNLQSYTAAVNQADTDFVKYYKVMASYFE